MIAEYLNRDVVRDHLKQLIAELDSVAPTDVPDKASVVEELRQAEKREESVSSGPRSYEPPRSERRGERPVPLDDFAFISHDPIVSLVQSAFDESSERHDELAHTPPPDDERRGPNDIVLVADVRLKNAPPPRRTPDGRRVFDKFSITDVRWVGSKVSEGIRLFRGKYPFPKAPAPPCDMKERVRLVVVGDWGSGLPRARKVAQQMGRVVEEGIKEGLDQHVIHLGDVYYSGWGREYNKYVLPHWPVATDDVKSVGSWSLNGNHDMYSGGHAYFDVMLADPRFERQAKSSYFSLVNKHWKILGIDTSYEDAKLCDPQPSWLQSEITGEKRRVMLLSHHQLFSAYEGVSKNLVATVEPILAARPIDAWLWGHEHRCMTYRPHANVQFGRCIGHGGVPVYQWHQDSDPYPAPGAYEYRAFHRKGLENWALMGFSVFDFDGPSVSVRYIDEDGRQHHTESF